MISASNNRKPVPYELYKLKKNKEPDHLFSLIEKSRKEKQNIDIVQNNTLDSKVKQAIRRHMIEKRVHNILASSPKNMNKGAIVVSQPVKCIQKPWVPPLEKQIIQKKFSQEQLLTEARKKEEKALNREKFNNILKVINLNKKMRYFGDYLSSEYDGLQKKSFSICNIPKTKESKLTFLEAKYKKIMAKNKPKLFVLNAPAQKEKYFFNPLQGDQYFGTIMKTSDKDLMRILIKTLSEQGNFSLTSFTKFYDIFVWQSALREDLTKFVTKILMQDKQQLPITKISNKIDEICEKINLQELNHNLQNFSQIMKKLLFGEEFIFALKNEYFLTRKALAQSLERNQECISIFINVFYV